MTDSRTAAASPSSNKVEFIATCHCKRVRVKFWADPNRLVAWDCDCSDCNMRQNVHLVVPKADFQVAMEEESLEEATTLYQWGTKTAIRRFCKTCGESMVGFINPGNLILLTTKAALSHMRHMFSFFYSQESCPIINPVPIPTATALPSTASTGPKEAR